MAQFRVAIFSDKDPNAIVDLYRQQFESLSAAREDVSRRQDEDPNEDFGVAEWNGSDWIRVAK